MVGPNSSNGGKFQKNLTTETKRRQYTANIDLNKRQESRLNEESGKLFVNMLSKKLSKGSRKR